LTFKLLGCLAGAAAAVLALYVIHALGGFYAPAPAAQVAPDGAIWATWASLPKGCCSWAAPTSSGSA